MIRALPQPLLGMLGNIWHMPPALVLRSEPEFRSLPGPRGLGEWFVGQWDLMAKVALAQGGSCWDCVHAHWSDA